MSKEKKSIGIIDYGMGNLRNVKNALDYLGTNSFVSQNVKELDEAVGLILPGVGAFYDAMVNLKKKDMIDFIRKKTLEEKVPFLGICLGMQILFEAGYEVEYCPGIGIMKGKVVKFPPGQKVPHMGWNNLNIKKSSKILNKIPQYTYVYFVHSFYVELNQDKGDDDSKDILIATCNYGHTFPAVVEKDNIFATQFHPEKSGTYGLEILKNFTEVVSC